MHGFSIHGVLYTTGKKEKNQTMNEKDIQQSANEFVTALINTLGNGTVQEIVESHRNDAFDSSHVAVKLPHQEMSPDVVKYLKKPCRDR